MKVNLGQFPIVSPTLTTADILRQKSGYLTYDPSKTILDHYAERSPTIVPVPAYEKELYPEYTTMAPVEPLPGGLFDLTSWTDRLYPDKYTTSTLPVPPPPPTEMLLEDIEDWARRSMEDIRVPVRVVADDTGMSTLVKVALGILGGVLVSRFIR